MSIASWNPEDVTTRQCKMHGFAWLATAVALHLLPSVSGTLSPQAPAVYLTAGKPKKMGTDMDVSGFGNLDGRVDMRTTINVEPDIGQSVGGTAGIYLQLVTDIKRVGVHCSNTVPSVPECGYSRSTILEWVYVPSPAVQGEAFLFKDYFATYPEGVGCMKYIGVIAWFYPAGAEGYGDFESYLKEYYKDAQLGAGGASAGKQLPAIGGDTPNTGDAHSGMFDRDGDGVEDPEEPGEAPRNGRSLESLITPHESRIVRPQPEFGGANQTQRLKLEWNYCPPKRTSFVSGGSGSPAPFF